MPSRGSRSVSSSPALPKPRQNALATARMTHNFAARIDSGLIARIQSKIADSGALTPARRTRQGKRIKISHRAGPKSEKLSGAHFPGVFDARTMPRFERRDSRDPIFATPISPALTVLRIPHTEKPADSGANSPSCQALGRSGKF